MKGQALGGVDEGGWTKYQDGVSLGSGGERMGSVTLARCLHKSVVNFCL